MEFLRKERGAVRKSGLGSEGLGSKDEEVVVCKKGMCQEGVKRRQDRTDCPQPGCTSHTTGSVGLTSSVNIHLFSVGYQVTNLPHSARTLAAQILF